MRLHDVTEGWLIALDQLRANKLRSALTVLGVVIGIATVMAMASIVTGFRQQIVSTLEVVGPTTIRVLRSLQQTPLSGGSLPREVRLRPLLEPSEAEALGQLSEIRYAAIWTQLFERLAVGDARTQQVGVLGLDDRFMDILGGEMEGGRLFTQAELRGGAPVVILEHQAVDKLFGPRNPLGRTVRVGGKPHTVVGIWRRPTNIFQPPGQAIAAFIPYETARNRFRYDEANVSVIVVRPRTGVPVNDALDAVTLRLRRLRGLKTGEPNNFDLLTSEQVLGIFDSLTSAFFLIMLVLSSIALLVGGIGVMAIMMVSVTSRTREIGLRKAMGATRREILWQFLVEAATLTLMGGVIGIALGVGLGEVLRSMLNFTTKVPLWSAVVATVMSILVGIIFGLAPANHAARLDPVEALRYE